MSCTLLAICTFPYQQRHIFIWNNVLFISPFTYSLTFSSYLYYLPTLLSPLSLSRSVFKWICTIWVSGSIFRLRCDLAHFEKEAWHFQVVSSKIIKWYSNNNTQQIILRLKSLTCIRKSVWIFLNESYNAKQTVIYIVLYFLLNN